jgi:hypothetical protein
MLGVDLNCALVPPAHNGCIMTLALENWVLYGPLRVGSFATSGQDPATSHHRDILLSNSAS